MKETIRGVFEKQITVQTYVGGGNLKAVTANTNRFVVVTTTTDRDTNWRGEFEENIEINGACR